MQNIVPGATIFDLVDGMEMNNDCLKLLQKTIETNEGEVPDGFCILLQSVTSTYEDLRKGFHALSNV